MHEVFDDLRRCGVTVNGRIHVELRDRHAQPVPNDVAGFLDRLDGLQRFAVSFWPIADSQDFDHIDLRDGPTTYVQAAGNHNRMTLELRTSGDHGARHYVLGKAQHTEAEPGETIRWDSYSTNVFGTEVFTAAEAVPLFLSYWLAGHGRSTGLRAACDRPLTIRTAADPVEPRVHQLTFQACESGPRHVEDAVAVGYGLFMNRSERRPIIPTDPARRGIWWSGVWRSSAAWVLVCVGGGLLITGLIDRRARVLIWPGVAALILGVALLVLTLRWANRRLDR